LAPILSLAADPLVKKLLRMYSERNLALQRREEATNRFNELRSIVFD
jgi:hypothetical protein